MATQPIPAATLIAFRENAGRTEHLFVERSTAMVFAAGAIVFPGGRVDPGDRMLAERFMTLDAEDAAARVAAIRETIEEAGIAVGLSPTPDGETLRVLRDRLRDGVVFADALAAANLEIEPAALTAFARWCPNMQRARNFDTRFYLAQVSMDAHEATVDETENVRLFWATAQEVLDDADAGRVQIIYPTRRNLERLAMLGDFRTACLHANAIPPDLISPWIEERDGVPHLRIPDDRGYPITSEALSSTKHG